jgi:hypothetical protein
MAKIQCSYCHELVDAIAYPFHEAKHRATQSDGQQKDYATLPADEREEGDLAGVPRVYIHRKCGVATQMPEKIIRTYLKNPYFYSDDTFCCGCNRHVPSRECDWEETGENLQTYTERLRAAKPEMKSKAWLAAMWVLALVLLGVAVALWLR